MGHHAWIAKTPPLTQLEYQGAPPDKISVEVLGLSEQELNELRMFNINTIQELVNCAKSGFLSIPNLGITTVGEIKKKLNSYLSGQLSGGDWESYTAAMNKEMIEAPLLESLEHQGDPLDKISVEVLGLSEQELNELRIFNINTIQELINCAKSGFLSIPDLGITTIGEIKKKLNSYLSGRLSEGDWESDAAVMNKQIVEAPLLESLEDQGDPLARVSVQVLGLNERASKRLRKANISTIQQLVNCTESYLLSIKGLGPITVEDIKNKLNSYTGVMNKKIVEVPLLTWKQLEYQCNVFESQGLLDDLSLPSPPSPARKKLCKATGEKLETLGDLKRLIDLCSSQTRIPERDEERSTTIPALKQAIVWLNKVLAYESIDNEVNELVQYFGDRERFVLTNRFGIEKRLTLEMIGKRFGITRERVRQIESRMRNKLIDRIGMSPLFYSTAGVVLIRRLYEDATGDSWKQHLIDIGLLKTEAAADLLVAISRASRSPLLALPEKFGQSREVYVPPHILLAKKLVLYKARKFYRNSGAVRIVSLTSERLPKADVEQILCLDEFTEVYSGWWMRKVGECVPERVARKVITYCGPVSSSTMHYALRRYLSRFQFPPPPSEVLVRILKCKGEFASIDGLLQLNNRHARKPSLTGPESVFVRVVRTEGPVVSFETAHARLLEASFSTGSVTSLLRYSPIVQKIMARLYTQLGTQYDAADVERARSQVTKIPANSRMKPRPDGIVEFETNVGTWLTYGGVVGSGPAASMKGVWTLICNNTNQGDLVIEGNFIRGLSEVSETLAIVAGDRIRIEFNTWTREATITKMVNDEQIG